MGVLAAIIGFSTTYLIPMGKRTFSAPMEVHIHGLFAFSWIFLFAIQSQLIHYRNIKMHRALGIISLLIAFGVGITMVPVGLFAVHKELAQGLGMTAYSGFLGVIISGLMYLVFVLAGFYFRKKPHIHKRLMLLATIIVLWPAWFRFRHFFPSVPHPEVWFALVLADSLIIMAWIWDYLRNGYVHPVLKYFGLLIICEQTFEVLAFDSRIWRNVSLWAYHLAA